MSNDADTDIIIALDDRAAALVIFEGDEGVAFDVIDGTKELEDGEESPVSIKIAIGLGYIASTNPAAVIEAYTAAITGDDNAEPEWAQDVEGNA
jgi:hypothetical protein